MIRTSNKEHHHHANNTHQHQTTMLHMQCKTSTEQAVIRNTEQYIREIPSSNLFANSAKLSPKDEFCWSSSFAASGYSERTLKFKFTKVNTIIAKKLWRSHILKFQGTKHKCKWAKPNAKRPYIQAYLTITCFSWKASILFNSSQSCLIHNTDKMKDSTQQRKAKDQTPMLQMHGQTSKSYQ